MRYAKKTIKRAPKKIYRKKRVYKKSTKNFNKAVKRVIIKTAETKHCGNEPQVYDWGNTGSSSIMSPAVELSSCFNLVQGTGQGDRIGNSVDCTKAVLNYLITMYGTDGTADQPPLYLHMFIGYLRNTRAVAPTNFSRLYQDGSSASAWDGTNLTTLRSINKDEFIVVKRKIIKIGPSTVTAAGGRNFNNNDFPSMAKGKISLKSMLGKITWSSDNTSGTYKNRQLYMWCGVTYLDNLTTTIPPEITFQYYVDAEFKDL